MVRKRVDVNGYDRERGGRAERVRDYTREQDVRYPSKPAIMALRRGSARNETIEEARRRLDAGGARNIRLMVQDFLESDMNEAVGGTDVDQGALEDLLLRSIDNEVIETTDDMIRATGREARDLHLNGDQVRDLLVWELTGSPEGWIVAVQVDDPQSYAKLERAADALGDIKSDRSSNWIAGRENILRDQDRRR